MQFIKSGKVFSPYSTKFLLFFTLAVLSLNVWVAVALIFLVYRPQLWLILSCTIPLGLLDVFLIGSFITLTIHTRQQLRQQYDIEEQIFPGAEDIVIGTWCSCCSISQMGRHNADYETYREQILSPTGLPRHLESIVPKHIYNDGSKGNESVYSF